MEKMVQIFVRRSRLLFAVAFMLASLWASAQTGQEGPAETAIPPALDVTGSPDVPADQMVYIVRSVRFHIQGATIERLLRQKVNIIPGTSFPSLEEFLRFLEQRRQILLNERVLADARAEYTIEKGEANRFFVDILFSTTDSWNTIALPYFKYDSNDGLTLSIRGRNYNFLGSMQALVLNLDYSIDTLDRHSYGGFTSFSLPFQLFSHDASVSISEDLAVHADGRPTSSIANLGFSIALPGSGFPLYFQANQGLQSNPDEVDNDIDPYFLSSSMSLSAPIPSGLVAGEYGPVSYVPSLTASLNWRPGEMVRDDRKGLEFTFSHGLYFGRVDWINNMRKGMSASLSNTDGYNLLTQEVTTDIDGSFIFHATSGGLIGFDSRFLGFHSFSDTERTELGKNMRGIVDARLHGTSADFLNLQTPIKLFDFPTHLFIGKNWFDFEFQLTPFVDVGYCRNGSETSFWQSMWYTGGIEFTVYPLRMRTFIVRASAGFDLDAVMKNKSLTAPSPRDGGSPYEIFFGLGLFF